MPSSFATERTGLPVVMTRFTVSRRNSSGNLDGRPIGTPSCGLFTHYQVSITAGQDHYATAESMAVVRRTDDVVDEMGEAVVAHQRGPGPGPEHSPDAWSGCVTLPRGVWST